MSVVEESVLADKVGQLTARADTELEKDVGEVRADRAGGDLKRASNFLVGFSRCDHPRDFHLAAGQSRRATRHRLWWRPDAELPHLLARSIELDGRSEACEHFMRLAE